MNGPQHFVEAERLLVEYAEAQRKVEEAQGGGGGFVAAAWGQVIEGAFARTLAEAQVHATLALAAASAENIRRNGAVASAGAGWSEVLS